MEQTPLQTLKRIIEEDHFSVEELMAMPRIRINSIVDNKIAQGYNLVFSVEFTFQVLFNPETKHVIVMEYGIVIDGDSYENDYAPYYTYVARSQT